MFGASGSFVMIISFNQWRQLKLSLGQMLMEEEVKFCQSVDVSPLFNFFLSEFLRNLTRCLAYRPSRLFLLLQLIKKSITESLHLLC